MSRPIVRIKKCCFQPFRTYNAYVTISVKDKVFVVPENNSESAYVRRMQQGVHRITTNKNTCACN